MNQVNLQKALFPPDEKEITGEWSRYAGHGMLLHAANELGCSDAAKVIDVSGENDKISHSARYNAMLMCISVGKSRLSQIDEVIPKEFEALCGNYPKKSSSHEYLNEIVRRDTELLDNKNESIIESFVDMSSKGYYKANIIKVNEVYIDKHVIEINTKEDIARDMHGTKDKIVKSIGGYWAVDADMKNPITFMMFCGGNSFAKLLKPFIEKMEGITGKPVRLIGVDKGAYNYVEILNALEGKEDTCIVVWAKDTSVVIEKLKNVSKELFEPYEVEEIEESDGSVSKKILTSIADAGEIIVDKSNHMVRTIVIQNEESDRRIGIFVFGEKANTLNKFKVADFLYGKQDVENHFKNRKKVGSDKFCGGKYSKIQMPELTEEDLSKMKKRVITIDKKIPKIENDKTVYKELLEKDTISKSDFKQLNNKAEKDITRLNGELEILNNQIESDCKEAMVDDKPTSKLDVRKMTIISQIQDHVLVCRKFILQLFIKCLIIVLTNHYEENKICDTELISGKIHQYISNLNKTKLCSRLFEQGGHIYKNIKTQELFIVMNDYDNLIMQKAYELLCEEFKHFNTTIEVDRIPFKLIYTTEKIYHEKNFLSEDNIPKGA
jgi:hypothetical protein